MSNNCLRIKLTLIIRLRPVSSSGETWSIWIFSEFFLCYNILSLYIILLSNIIHDIQNMIFSVVYRFLSYPMFILIKIHKFFRRFKPVDRAAISTDYFKPSTVIFDRSQHFVSTLLTSVNCSSQNGQIAWFSFNSFNKNSWIFLHSIYIILLYINISSNIFAPTETAYYQREKPPFEETQITAHIEENNKS